MFWYIYTKFLGIYVHAAHSLCKLYLECSSDICSVMSVKYVYSAPCSFIDTSDFIYGIFMCIHPPYMHVKYLTHMSYMPNLVDIFGMTNVVI